MKFGKVVKDRRTRLGISQEQLADDLHIARQSVSKWERGEAYPSIGMLIKLSDFFGITVDELIKGDNYLKQKIVEDGEQINHPRLKLFFDWIFLTGAVLLIARIIVVLLVKFDVVDWNIGFFQGWVPSLITLACMLIGGIGSDELKKDIKR